MALGWRSGFGWSPFSDRRARCGRWVRVDEGEDISRNPCRNREEVRKSTCRRFLARVARDTPKGWPKNISALALPKPGTRGPGVLENQEKTLSLHPLKLTYPNKG